MLSLSSSPRRSGCCSRAMPRKAHAHLGGATALTEGRRALFGGVRRGRGAFRGLRSPVGVCAVAARRRIFARRGGELAGASWRGCALLVLQGAEQRSPLFQARG